MMTVDLTTTTPERAATTNTSTSPLWNNDSSFSCIDVSLLRGLEPVMTRHEQALVTAMLVSGDVNELAKAAKILHSISDMLVKQGVASVGQRSDTQSQRLNESFHAQIKQSKQKGRAATATKVMNPPAFNDREVRVAQELKELEREFQIRSTALPLPVRMPRLVVLDAFDPNGTEVVVERQTLGKLVGMIAAKVGKGGDQDATHRTITQKPSLTFVDDTWDGTLGAAFTKVHVTNKDVNKGGPLKKAAATTTTTAPRMDTSGHEVHVIHDDLKPSPGFDEIVCHLEGGYEARLLCDDDATGRVLIATTHNDGAKVGLARGDVVTHINGEDFSGGTAADLKLMIAAHYAGDASEYNDNCDVEHTSQQLEIVVNAELCIAQALKLRAMGPAGN